MGLSPGAVVADARINLLGFAVVYCFSLSALNKYYFAVGFVGVKADRRPRHKAAGHYFGVAVVKHFNIIGLFAAAKVGNFLFFDFRKIYYHTITVFLYYFTTIAQKMQEKELTLITV
jgi:hypothetical protein